MLCTLHVSVTWLFYDSLLTKLWLVEFFVLLFFAVGWQSSGMLGMGLEIVLMLMNHIYLHPPNYQKWIQGYYMYIIILYFSIGEFMIFFLFLSFNGIHAKRYGLWTQIIAALPGIFATLHFPLYITPHTYKCICICDGCIGHHEVEGHYFRSRGIKTVRFN